MEARALNPRPPSRVPRAVYAAALLGVLLAALLGAWFVSGWHDVRLRQDQVRTAPARAADAKADELGHELRGELEALLAREVKRPYFHYQNLMHDPKASAGVSVSPSPLARGVEDPLVAGYFQIDSKGRASTPTINDEVPDLSEPENLAGNRAFRDQVTHDLVATLTPPPLPPGNVLVAQVEPRQPKHAPVQAQQVQAQTQATQVIEIDPSTYAQNASSNAVYWSQHDNNNNTAINNFGTPQVATTHVEAPPPDVTHDATPNITGDPTAAVTGDPTHVANGNPAPEPSPPKPAPPKPAPPKPAPRPRVASPAPAPSPAAPVTIVVSALAWQTLPFGGGPALVAVRQVQTPDGNLAQGFVIDRATLTGQLAGKAGDMVAELHGENAPQATNATTAAARVVEIAPGWQLTVAPNPRTLIRSAHEAASIARTFIIRFVSVGAIALLVAGCVLLLVMRAEKLASERSQFAAAAAHELRTPLAGLQLYGDMLADGLGDQGKVRDYARRMSEEAARLGRVVSNVLGFSQLERGNLSVDAQVGPLGDALCELAERAQPALDRAGAVLELDVAPDLRAKFDRDALARIVGNLLDNAEKYGRAAEDRTIRLAAIDKGDAIDVVVSDHGPGVAAGANLFRAFSRGVPADGPAGLGLGLALSRSLAVAMGGELLHAPADGGGAAFTLRLPRA